jgi:diacylglycerol O-acyltransferase
MWWVRQERRRGIPSSVIFRSRHGGTSRRERIAYGEKHRMSAAKRLNPLDWTFLAAETRESMMHIGSLMSFSPPADAAPDFLRQLMDEVRSDTALYPPWNLKLRHPQLLASPLQGWVEDTDFDVDYHVRRSALPAPGDERELGILVSRLHSHGIDFHRPPWEVHFIEGLEGGRIAIYFKVHHALVDGYTGMKLMSQCLSSDPDERDTPIFHARAPASRAAGGNKGAPAPTLSMLLGIAREQLSATRMISRALLNTVRPATAQAQALVAPMQAPKSVLNQKISRNRRFATQQFPVDRLKQVAKTHAGTLNDVVLALCAGSLRRLLQEQDALPEEPLTAMLPVNIRPKDDPGGGNAVGAILATLGTDAVQRTADGADGDDADSRCCGTRAPGFQSGDLERAGTTATALFPRLPPRCVLPAVDPVPGLRAQYHRSQLSRYAELRVHRLSRYAATSAAAGGLRARGTGRTRSVEVGARHRGWCGDDCEPDQPRL